MKKDQFFKKCKAVKIEKRVQHTGSFSNLRSCGFDYYVYVCPINFETFNPFTAKHKGRPYRCFFSSVSAYHAKEQAYKYIVQQNGMFSDNEC
ncbi:hypothetical protein MTP09_05995 [Chryseobacterium suipulveris]|uniref:Uncharacterized protein n=1 Tax=Chryseobacterium suipulveris TaxID=2929800 RepID=A0ABY4BSM2_9FLAO|nr:hypothetical protein [Chryseobacterium suipulveris]UOE42186.1 hypothetical protein MTP09_05995 [Chryseobacterium suipulveris]